MRSSAVADFYATKYLAKPQQWLTSALGPLIAGFKRIEDEQKHADEPLSVKATALRKVRAVIFAANRSVWISSCEACLFLETGGSAVQSHLDVAVHGRKGFFMMHECKRILNKQVAGEGLWQTDLLKCQGQQEGEVLEIHGPTEDVPSAAEHSHGAAEHTHSEEGSDDTDNIEEVEEGDLTNEDIIG